MSESQINSREKTFSDIYSNNKWGGETGEFYSGEGSHSERLFEKYIDYVNGLINEKSVKTVVDLGCGDFNIGQRIHADQYCGVDIVEQLIDRNRREYAKENIRFECLDIVDDELPDGDLCLVRQVLQHLSNEEIKKVLGKLVKYRYVVVTEHVTNEEYISDYNLDQEHSHRIRCRSLSGVYLDHEPFSMKCRTVLSIPYDGKSSIISVLIENP